MEYHEVNENQVTVGVIGVGRIGKKHAEVFSGEGIGGSVKLLAVADVDEKKVAQVAAETNSQPYTDYHELLKLKPDLVVISTPHHLHREMGVAAAQAGCHLLMEKPLAATLADAREIVEVCEKEGVKLGVGFAHRYRQEFQMAYQLLRNGTAGTPGMVVDIFGNPGGRYIPDWVWKKKLSGGGIVTYSGIHSIDWQCWLMDSDVTEVYARSLTSYKGSDVEDAFIGTMVFANGAIGSLIGNQPDYPVSPRTRNTEVYGSSASVRLRMGEYLMFSNQDQSYQVNITRDDPFVGQAVDILNAIRQDRNPSIGGADGLRAQAIMTALYRSAETGQKVSVDEIL